MMSYEATVGSISQVRNLEHGEITQPGITLSPPAVSLLTTREMLFSVNGREGAMS